MTDIKCDFSADEVASLTLIPLESGGFLYEVELKAPLQIPVRLMFVYFEVGSDRSRNFTSREQFINTMSIRYVAEVDRVPFDNFHVEVALVYERDQQAPLVGPFFIENTDYSEY